MNLFDTSCCLLTGSLGTTLVESLHVRLLNNWIKSTTLEYLHPQCAWKLADGHPHTGVYQGNDFYNEYVNYLANTYSTWIEVVDSVIGSTIGGIIVGSYYFQQEPDGPYQSAAFTHFYRIEDELIVTARFYIGDVKTSAFLPHSLINAYFTSGTLSLN